MGYCGVDDGLWQTLQKLNFDFDFFQPIESWTCENVVEWMACVRLYRYAQIFKDEQINGKDIKDMDPDKLKVKYFNK